MRILLSALWCALVFVSGFSYAQSASSESAPADTLTYEIDAQATAQAPWKVGEVIAQKDGYPFEDIALERKFIGVTTKGYFVVQDFYQGSRQKMTDPFLIRQRDEVEKIEHFDSTSLEGLFISWYRNGQKWNENVFRNGLAHGLWTTWYENGQKMTEVVYEDGKAQGLGLTWHMDGKKLVETRYQDGKKEGLFMSWDMDGKKLSEGQYEDGKKQGVWSLWFANRQKWQEEFYQDGKMHGVWTEWYENGQKRIEGQYQDGEKQGVWTVWDKNGNKVSEVDFGG